jgi:SPP1 family predicted phage head-tail adaptor
MPAYKPKVYDPGRLRFKIDFYAEDYTDNDSGGQVVNPALILSTFAAQEDIREGNQAALEAGATVFNQDCFFIIRHRKDFYPSKGMEVHEGQNVYKIEGITPLNQPISYIKLLCIKRS